MRQVFNPNKLLVTFGLPIANEKKERSLNGLSRPKRLTSVFAVGEHAGGAAAPSQERQGGRHQAVHDAALPRPQGDATGCGLREEPKKDKNQQRWLEGRLGARTRRSTFGFDPICNSSVIGAEARRTRKGTHTCKMNE